MSDHEPTPPSPPTSLIKSVAPTQAPPASAFPMSGFNPAVPSQAPAPQHQSAPPSVSQAQVDTFTFEFQREGVPYRVSIMSNQHTGLSVDLQKYQGGSWVKSVSRMKDGILGAFALQQAIQQATSAAKPNSGAEASVANHGTQEGA